MTNNANQRHSEIIKRRFERDAVAFDAIYDTTKSEFTGWFNKSFRKPIFERYEITFEVLGDLTNKTVLDVGCGSGVYSIKFALNGAAKVKGIDFSAPMLQIAKTRANNHHVSSKCEFELNDFLTMDTNQKYDYSIAMGVFDYLPEPVTFLRRLKAVTNKRIVISFPGHSLIREPLRKMRYLLTSKGRVHFYSYHDIKKLVDAVGFSHAEIRPIKTGSGFILIADV